MEKSALLFCNSHNCSSSLRDSYSTHPFSHIEDYTNEQTTLWIAGNSSERSDQFRWGCYNFMSIPIPTHLKIVPVAVVNAGRRETEIDSYNLLLPSPPATMKHPLFAIDRGIKAWHLSSFGLPSGEDRFTRPAECPHQLLMTCTTWHPGLALRWQDASLKENRSEMSLFLFSFLLG